MNTVAIQTKTWKYQGKSYEVKRDWGNAKGYYLAYSNESGEWEEYGLLKRKEKIIKCKRVWDFDWVGFYTGDTDEEEMVCDRCESKGHFECEGCEQTLCDDCCGETMKCREGKMEGVVVCATCYSNPEVDEDEESESDDDDLSWVDAVADAMRDAGAKAKAEGKKKFSFTCNIPADYSWTGVNPQLN